MELKIFFPFLVGILLYNQVMHSQKESTLSIDSLTTLSSKKLYTQYMKYFDEDTIKAGIYAKAYLQKAKTDNIEFKVAYGYSFMAFIEPNNFKKKILYLDSCIAYSSNIDYKYFPTLPYIYKGTAYDNNGFFSKALDNYVKGLASAKKKNDSYYEFIINHNIALLKRKLGKYEEAKSLFRKTLNYEASRLKDQTKDSIGYLSTYAELINTYIKNKEIDSAFILNNEGYKISQEKLNHCLFVLNEGIILYHQKKYKLAIKSLKKALQEFKKPENEFFSEHYNLIDTYLFLGKSNLSIGNKKLAISYYKQIDSLVQKTDYLIPEIKPAYMEIINYYKSRDDAKSQLYYINRLLYNDSILDYRFRDLNNKLVKDYDTPILVSEKERLISILTSKNKQSYHWLIISGIIIFISIILLLFNLRKRRQYKNRFQELMNTTQGISVKKENINKEEKSIPRTDIGITKEVVDIILEGLNRFEKNNGFTSTNITSVILAKKLKTNTKYLTKVIKYHRGKSFTNYINDLRVDYITKALKTDTKLQKYTVKALAAEAGFNSTEVFSKSFYKKTGIYPSYFVKQLLVNNA